MSPNSPARRHALLSLSVLLLCMTATALGQLSAKKVPGPGGRGMWVWGGIDYSSAASISNFLNFMQAPHGYPGLAIDRVILYAGSSMLSGAKADNMRTFLREAHKRGILVEYLDGDAKWTLTAAATQTPKSICSQVVAFNKATADTTDDFDGIHMDIEPHVLGATWTSNAGRGKDAYNDDVQDNLLDIYRTCAATIAAGDPKMTLAADIGVWYVAAATDIWSGFMRDQSVDYLTIMDYKDQQAPFQQAALQNMNAVSGKIKITVGVESIDEASAPPEQSFWQEGFGPLEIMLSTTKNNVQSNKAFGGFCIHHYGSYVSLPFDKTGRAGAVPAAWSKARADYPLYGSTGSTGNTGNTGAGGVVAVPPKVSSTPVPKPSKTATATPPTGCVCANTNRRDSDAEGAFVVDDSLLGAGAAFAASGADAGYSSNMGLVLAAAAGWCVALVATANMIVSERKRREFDSIHSMSSK